MDVSSINAPTILNANTAVDLGNTSRNYKLVKNDRTAGFIACYDHLVPSEDEASSGIDQKITTSFAPQGQSFPDEVVSSSVDAKEDDFSIFDLVDMINPLQHIPVLNYAYRSITGDTIKPISSIIGGAIFGGPIGAASSLVSAVIEGETGKSVPETVISFVRGDSDAQMAAYKNLAPEMLAFAEVPLVNDQNYDYN